MTLDFVHGLSKRKQIILALKLTKIALPIWDNYAKNYSLIYQDGVVGLNHNVNEMILRASVNGVDEYSRASIFKKLFKGKNDLLKLRAQFDDPIIALQDGDWVLPDEVKMIFYSVFNLLEFVLGEEDTLFGDSSIYVSINQVLEGVNRSNLNLYEDINRILREANDGR